jgi:lysophospholipase L1-like esterase
VGLTYPHQGNPSVSVLGGGTNLGLQAAVYGTAAEWLAANPVLGKGELGHETDTGVYKVGDGSTVWSSLTTAGSGTYGQLAPARYATGLLWGFAGDSITNGSTASNSVYSYPAQSLMMVGGLNGRPDSIEAGTPGDTSTLLLARIDTTLNAYSLGGLVILIGTNDAGASVSASTFASNVTSIIAKAKAKGCPVVLCTVPPRASGASSTIHNLIRAYNAWIRIFGAMYGCEIADVYAGLVDTTTGYLTSGYDAGDGIHPNDLGHQKIAIEVAKAMKRLAVRTSPYGLVTSISGGTGALIADPLNARATVTTGWSELAGGTGTAPSYSFVNDTSGVLPAGRWAEMDFTGTSGGVRRLQSPTISSGFAVGDKLLLTAHLQVEDVSGTWLTDIPGSVNTTHVALNVVNQTPVSIAVPLQNCCGLVNSSGYYDYAPVMFPFTVPAAVTSMNLWLQAKVATGKHIKYRLGAVQITNLTTLGLDSLLSWGTALVNT